jgi:hypothetical protein
MIRTKYKKLTEGQIDYIIEAKATLAKFIELVNCSTINKDATDEEADEYNEAKAQAILRATEASFWFTQMETT